MTLNSNLPALVMLTPWIDVRVSRDWKPTLHGRLVRQKYCSPATHPEALVRFDASSMVIDVHTGASSYLSKAHYRSCSSCKFFLSSSLLSSAASVQRSYPHAVLEHAGCVCLCHRGGHWRKCFMEVAWLRTALVDKGHASIQTNYACAAGIVKYNIKQRSKAIVMRFYWVRDRERQNLSYSSGTGVVASITYPTTHQAPLACPLLCHASF